MTADDIIRTARDVIGARFRHLGRDPANGLDCAGLIVHVAKELDIVHDDLPVYPRLPSGGLLESMLDAQPELERVKGRPNAGDILLMRFGGDPQHLAILTADNTIVHAWAIARKVCEHDLTDEWRRRIVRAYRFRGVEA